MPADFHYWNPAEIDSEDAFPRTYIDPWDFENYIYFRDHLDSRERVSESSSLEDPNEIGPSYYAPIAPKPNYSPIHDQNNRFDSLFESEYSGTAKYAEIEDVYGEILPLSNYVPSMDDGRRMEAVKNHGVQSLGLEPFIQQNIVEVSRTPPAAIYGTGHQHHHHHHHKKEDAFKRRMSYSYGDYEYSHYAPQSLYTRLEGRRSESERPSPIYDDIGANRIGKPENFGLSTYGHLQIDYSCSWSDLDKYIYN